MGRAAIFFSIIILGLSLSTAPADEPKAGAEQMTRRKETVMYLARAIAIGDWKETTRLSIFLDETMREHAKVEDKHAEHRKFYEQIWSSSDALRKGAAAADDQQVLKSFSSLLTACLNCHRVHAPDRSAKN